jgi:hypothetical protein
MPTPAIIERVKQVHDELGEAQPDFTRAPDVDIDAIKKQLAAVMLEPDHKPHYDSLGDKLLYAYIGFQIDHPKLAASMQTLANDLAKAGL